MKLKLSFTSLGCPDWSFDRILEQGVRMGYDAVEIRGVAGVMEAENIPEFSPENAQKTKERLAQIGFSIAGFGTSAKFHDPEALQAGVHEGKRAIDVCQRMGIPFIRVFGDQIDDPAQTDEIAAMVADGIGQLCEYARDKGVSVYQEVHGNFNTVEAISAVIRRVGDLPEFGIIWDVAHSDKVYGRDWRPFYEAIAAQVRHVHFKDHKQGTFALTLTGEGDIPLKDIAGQLVKDGYRGYFSFEWEKKWVPSLAEPEVAFPQYIEYMRGIESAL